MSQLYREKILDHYNEPRNFGTVEDPDLEAEVTNPNCGDELEFTARVKGGNVEDIRFRGDGCALSIASASLLTRKNRGEAVEDLEGFDDGEMLDMIGVKREELSPVRMKCVLLARDGMERLVENYDET